MNRWTAREWPLSRVNVILGVVLVFSLAGALFARAWLAGAVIAALLMAGIGSAIYAHLRSDSVLSRVSALEPSDERERGIVFAGLAAVGGAALIGTVGAFIGELVLRGAVTLDRVADDWPLRYLGVGQLGGGSLDILSCLSSIEQGQQRNASALD